MKHNILLFLILLTGTISGQSISKESYLLAHKHHIYSKVLQEEREIFIHKPQGFWGMDGKSRAICSDICIKWRKPISEYRIDC